MLPLLNSASLNGALSINILNTRPGRDSAGNSVQQRLLQYFHVHLSSSSLSFCSSLLVQFAPASLFSSFISSTSAFMLASSLGSLLMMPIRPALLFSDA